MTKKKSNSKQLGNPLAVAKVASKVAGATSTVRQTAKSYPSFFSLLGFGVLGLMGYSLLKKVQEDNKERVQDQKENDFSNNLNNSVKTDANGETFNPSEIASRYKQAIAGAGTSEQEIMNLARVSKGDRWASISSMYKYLTGNALLTDLQEDLSTDEYAIFLTILKSSTWFAVGEYVYPKTSSVKALNSSNKLVEANVYWNIGSLGKITGVKKATFSGKTQEFYKTEDYPDYWIWANELYTMYDRVG